MPLTAMENRIIIKELSYFLSFSFLQGSLELLHIYSTGLVISNCWYISNPFDIHIVSVPLSDWLILVSIFYLLLVLSRPYSRVSVYSFLV